MFVRPARIFLLLILGFSCHARADGNTEAKKTYESAEAKKKYEVTAAVTRYVALLQTLARSDLILSFNPEQEGREQLVKQEVSKVIRNVSLAGELSLLARISFAIAYPQGAETLRYDEVFYNSYQLCVKKLAAMKDKDAQIALMHIKDQLQQYRHEIEFINSVTR